MTESSVHNFLLDHPEFLEVFVLKHVSEETLEDWISKKKEKENAKGNEIIRK